MSDEETVDYVESPGPGIVDLDAAAASQTPIEPTPSSQQWEESAIRQMLQGTAASVHQIAGVAEQDWRMTQEDLDRIAPPLTRIANRYDPVLKLARVADPLLVAHGFALYGWRSALERQAVLRAQTAAQEDTQPHGYEAAEEAPERAQEPAETTSTYFEGDAHAQQ